MRLVLAAFTFGAITLTMVGTARAEALKCAMVMQERTAAEDALRAHLAALTARLQGVKNDVFALGKGRHLTVQSIQPATKNDPVLLMMPGVNRGLLATDPTVAMLAAQGFGVVVFHMSPQPLSVATLAKGERPAFRDQNLTLRDLAAEVEFLAARTKIQMGVENVIPVSLSYTGAVSPYLKGFPLVFETVPMTSAAATNPQLERYRQLLKSGELFNPIFGPGITRSMLDSAYKQQWTKQVEAMTEQFKLPAERRDDMIEGYTVLSRATEGFTWKDVKLPVETRRVFMLAGNESAPLLRHQLETFIGLLKTQQNAVAILILESGHVLPSEQPVAYSSALKMVTAGQLPFESGLVVIKPSTKEIQTFTGDAAHQMINKILAQIPKNSEENAQLTGP
ncbi:MAG: hypothetical protein ACK5P7_02880 [Bdellovibrio sp.]|jgi:hypothetical protein